MGDVDLTIPMLFQFGRTAFGKSKVCTNVGTHTTEATFAEVGDRVDRLASFLQSIGIGAGDRVATLQFNTQAHLEAYFAVPSIGAVLHTLNFRLHPEQFAYIVQHASDRVILVEAFLVPQLLAIINDVPTVEHVVVVGDLDPGVAVPDSWLSYETCLASADPASVAWPEIGERQAAAMCYTSGTTGDPKGVVYSHRSSYLHSLTFQAITSLTESDRVLPIVPMFHVNAWGMPYAGWMAGCDMVMPGRFLQGEPLSAYINAERPTFSAGVPTVWSDVLRYAESHPVALSALRNIVIGGSAVPEALIRGFRDQHGVTVTQAWGMTEMSPLGTVAIPPKHAVDDPAENLRYRTKTGRTLPGVMIRIVDDSGQVLPQDGVAVGELQARGPWVTTSYFGDEIGSEAAMSKFQKDADGSIWLRTGDVGSIDTEGFLQITDRAKDVIKSGGEWISSVDLENALMGHPAVAEAAVVAVPDARWDERPMGCIVLREGASVTPAELAAFLDGRVAKWWIPERWSFISEVPKTSTLKFDKKVLRARYGEGALSVETL